jgi:hypothetical protein
MSSDRFVQNHLRNLPLFERLSPQQLTLVTNIVEVIRYQQGQLVFQQGQPTRGMVIFVSGRGILARIGADGLEDRLGSVESGQYVNEAALHQEGIETASLRIVEESIVLFLDRRRFLQLLMQNPEIRTNLRVTTAPDSRQPTRKVFRGQRDDETVLHIFRHHWWSFARHGWTAAILAILLWIVAALVGVQSPVLGLAFGGLGVVLPGLLMIYLWFEWQNDYVIITGQRIVRIWRDVLRFENTINEIPLERIIEVNVELPPADVFARLFTYGTIDIRTAGEAANLHLRIMPYPKRLQTLIFAQRDRYREGMAQRNRDHIREEIERALGVPVVSKEQQAQNAAAANNDNRGAGLPFMRTRFENEAGEIYYRKDGTVWLAHVFLPVLALLASVVVALLSLVSPAFSLYGGSGLSAAFLLFLLGVIWFYLADWDWRNDLLVIGQQTISLVRKRPLWLQNEVERVRLAQVDNVISDVSGIFDSVFNRGEVRITLVGSDEQKRFGKVYDPQEVQAEISRRQAQMRAMVEEGDSQRQRQAIADYLAVYHETVSGTTPAPPFNAPAPPQPTFNPNAQPTTYNPYTDSDEHIEPTQTPTEPPPIRDAVRPPRVPRVRPPDDLPE